MTDLFFSVIPCEEKTPSTSENQSSESVPIRKKKFYTKKPRTAEFIQMLHAKWLRQWIAGNGLNPIMLINQIMPSAEYSLLSSENVSNKWHFVIQLNFNDQVSSCCFGCSVVEVAVRNKFVC